MIGQHVNGRKRRRGRYKVISYLFPRISDAVGIAASLDGLCALKLFGHGSAFIDYVGKAPDDVLDVGH